MSPPAERPHWLASHVAARAGVSLYRFTAATYAGAWTRSISASVAGARRDGLDARVRSQPVRADQVDRQLAPQRRHGVVVAEVVGGAALGVDERGAGHADTATAHGTMRRPVTRPFST